MTKQEIIDANFEAFKSKLPQLTKTHPGKFALMHDEKVIGLYDTVRDALLTGENFYSDGNFSVQQVFQAPVNLGFFSYASTEINTN